jgi:hypothetical protein
MLFFLSDYKYSNYARTLGAKDKKKRKSNLLRNVAIGAGGLALAGGLGYLALRGKGKPSGGSSPLSGSSSPSPSTTPSVSTISPSSTLSSTKKPFDDIDIKIEAPKIKESKPQIESQSRITPQSEPTKPYPTRSFTQDELLQRGNLKARYNSDPLYTNKKVGLYGSLTKKQLNSRRIAERRQKIANELITSPNKNNYTGINSNRYSYVQRPGKSTLYGSKDSYDKQTRKLISKDIKSLKKSYIDSNYKTYGNYINL